MQWTCSRSRRLQEIFAVPSGMRGPGGLPLGGLVPPPSFNCRGGLLRSLSGETLLARIMYSTRILQSAEQPEVYRSSAPAPRRGERRAGSLGKSACPIQFSLRVAVGWQRECPYLSSTADRIRTRWAPPSNITLHPIVLPAIASAIPSRCLFFQKAVLEKILPWKVIL